MFCKRVRQILILVSFSTGLGGGAEAFSQASRPTSQPAPTTMPVSVGNWTQASLPDEAREAIIVESRQIVLDVFPGPNKQIFGAPVAGAATNKINGVAYLLVTGQVDAQTRQGGYDRYKYVYYRRSDAPPGTQGKVIIAGSNRTSRRGLQLELEMLNACIAALAPDQGVADSMSQDSPDLRMNEPPP